MKMVEKPHLSPVFFGEQFKVLEVTGNAEVNMPLSIIVPVKLL